MPTVAGKQPFYLAVDDHLCHHCRRCLAAAQCRGHAFIRFDPQDGQYIDMHRCVGCLTCVVNCPFGAIVKTDRAQDMPGD